MKHNNKKIYLLALAFFLGTTDVKENVKYNIENKIEVTDTIKTKPIPTQDIIIKQYREIKPRFPINLLYIMKTIKAESGYDSTVTGAKGERGLMQITEDVWNDVNKGKISFERAYERELNIRTGIIHLNDLVRQIKIEYTGWDSISVNEQLKLTSAAYNTGYTNIKTAGFDITKMPKSTQEYINKIVK